MKKSLFVILICSFFFGHLLYADVTDNIALGNAPISVENVMVVTEEIPQSEFDKLIDIIGGNIGLGVLGIVIAIVQSLMFLLRTKLGKLAGRWRLAIVYFLTLILGVFGLKIQGMTWLVALLHSSNIATFQVFINQIIKQIKKEN